MKLKISLTFLIYFLCYFGLYAQIENHNYKRKLSPPSNLWHQVVLPEAIFSSINTNFSDLRIIGFNATNDTSEVAFIVSIPSNEYTYKEISFKLINASNNKNGYFWTFKTPIDKIINEINLSFENKNFDWNIHLEGSNNQNEWFTIHEKYRVLSIHNNEIDFNYTNIKFPKSNYNYYRISVNSNEVPVLKKATLSLQTIEKIALHQCAIKKMAQKNNNTTTEIDIELHNKYPINELSLTVADTLDYYRPIIIKQLKDSVQTEKGWIYNYITLTSSIMSSTEANEFHFNPTSLNKLKIIIYNNNNTPLTIDTVTTKGFVYKLIARFSDLSSEYFLYYGNKSSTTPSYDIINFKDKIPTGITQLKLSEEEKIIHEKEQEAQPLFSNNGWLWSIIIILILFLSWASLKMLKSK
jgi:hypothetical protein